MRFLIHGLKSLIRRPAKTTMLFIILFVVFNLIFTGFIIQNSIARSKDYIRSQIGSAVEYRMDFNSLRTAERPGNQAATAIPALSIKVAEKIATNHYVESYYITESANISSTAISPAQTQNANTGFQRDFSDFTFRGSNHATNLDFVLGNVKLTDGRNLSAADLSNGNKVVIISEDLAKANSLQVGDRIALSRATQPRPNNNGQGNSGSTAAAAADYEVIGIYKAVQDGFNVNILFTSNTVIYNLRGTTSTDETGGSIVFLLDSPEHVAPFKQEASPYLTSKYHVLYSDDSEYISLTKPLNLISFITAILIWVVFIAGAAIIMALVTIFVRDRKFEIGLLLSSGEGRLKIISQFIFEMLLIAIFAFVISIVSSSITSKSVSNWIVDNQLLSQTSLISTTTATTAPVIPNQNLRQNNISLYGAVNLQSVADEFDVSINTSVIGELLLASIILVLFGSSIPLVIIMGYKPRRILQDDT